MTRVKLISIVVVALSGLLVVGGSVGFFSQPLTQMPVIGAITISAFIVFLLFGIVWTLIDIGQSLAEFTMLGRAHPRINEVFTKCSVLSTRVVKSVPVAPVHRIDA